MLPPTATNIDVEPLVDLYHSKKVQIQSWFQRVRNELQVWMDYFPEQRIHSIRGRLKTEDHFRDKIARKGRDWNSGNLFDKVEDFAGMRVLTLYRNDLAILDYFIYRSSAWRVRDAEANYDETRHCDDSWFRDLGFIECKKLDELGTKCPCLSGMDCTNSRKLTKNDRGYSSIHYILIPRDMPEQHWQQNRHLKCELQIRTIHEEAWGEFSHEFTYPHLATDHLAGELIKRLSGLLHLAEDMVADIRRAPADGRLFQHAHFLGRSPAPSPQPAFDSIHELIANSHFLSRSAALSAIALTTEYRGVSPELSKGKTIDAIRLISLGFDRLDDAKKGDELARIYLDAHKLWKSIDDRREVTKFFVWEPSDGKSAQAQQLWIEFSTDIDMWIVPRRVHDTIVTQIATTLGSQSELFPSLASFQFFLWHTGDNTAPQKASLPRRSGLNEEEVLGFFAPYRDSNLVAGVLWLKDRCDPVYGILNAYLEILLDLRDCDALLMKISADEQQIAFTELTDQQQKVIAMIIDVRMQPVLSLFGV